MKILLICTTRTWGGLEQTAYRDALELNKRANKVHLLCTNDGILHKKAVIAGVVCHTISNESKYFNPQIFFKLSSIVREHGYEVVHFHSFNTILPCLTALFGKRCKVFATRHIYVEHSKKDLFHSFYLKRIDKMLAISEFSRRNILEMYPISEDKIETLYLGIDLTKYERSDQKGVEFRRKFKIPVDANVVGVLGRIDPAKGQMEFVEAVPQILHQYPKAYFVITGHATSKDEQWYLSAVEKRIQELGLKERVVLTGFIEDVPAVLSAMDVLVMPSYFETFGLVVIEAFACLVPVIATDMGSINEMISNNHSGIKIKPKSSQDIAEAVKTLLGSKELRDKIIIN